MYENLVDFMFEIGMLAHTPRSHHTHLLQPTESVSEHIFRVAVIAFILAKHEKADANKVVLMGLLHDIPETRVGDIDWLKKQYLIKDENKAIQKQSEKLGELGLTYSELLKEYKDRSTVEAKIVRDADTLAYVLGLKETAMTGNQESLRRLNEEEKHDLLFTETAKKLLDSIYAIGPVDWIQRDRQQTKSDFTDSGHN